MKCRDYNEKNLIFLCNPRDICNYSYNNYILKQEREMDNFCGELWRMIVSSEKIINLSLT